jgi:hypothetical protein
MNGITGGIYLIQTEIDTTHYSVPGSKEGVRTQIFLRMRLLRRNKWIDSPG